MSTNYRLRLTLTYLKLIRTYGAQRKKENVLNKILDLNEEEFEMPERFKDIINTGRIRNKEGKLPVPPVEYSYFIVREKSKIPDRFKNIINTRRTKKAHKDSPLILQPHQGYYRAEDEL